ncbi:conserved domain protein [Vibrio astriarenae]|nr:conserved domain protein [Vibrio sp. C7]
MELTLLQQQFGLALQYQSDGAECDITSNHFDADSRLQVYRNNFVISLSEVLSATYPMVELLLGDECFSQIARHHVLNTPLHKGDVSDYGESFDDTLTQFPNVIDAAPYIEDVASFEWSMDIAFHKAGVPVDEEVLQVQALAEIPAEQQGQVVFHLFPSVQLIKSNYALFELFDAVQSNCFDALDIHHAQQGVIQALPNGHRTPIALEPEIFQLVESIHQQQPLSDIAPELLPHLNTLMEKALIAGFTLAKH